MWHPDRGALERYLGGISPDGESRALQRHLAVCPECEERLLGLLTPPSPAATAPEEESHGVIRLLLDDQREAVASLRGRLAAERAAAPGLWRELGGDPEELGRRIWQDSRLQTWGFFEFLVDRAYGLIQEDTRGTEILLRLAVDAAELLVPERYGAGAREAAKARAWTWLANILRVQGHFQQAETAFQTAELYLSRSWLDPLDEALLLELRGALRRGQRRFEEAVELLDAAIAIYREVNEPHLQGRALSIQGLALQYMGDHAAAADRFRRSLFLADGVREPRLLVSSQYNLISCLQEAGQAAEAAELIPDARRMMEQVGKPADLLRLRWAEGRIDGSRGRLDRAGEILREVRQTFLDGGLTFDAALVSLDLAMVYLRQRRSEETRRLAAETIPVFQSREVHREALAALIVFQQAAELDELTAGLIEEITAYLWQARGNPQLRFRGDETGRPPGTAPAAEP
jgi:tetratricopeptide (TPR) repeat protein